MLRFLTTQLEMPVKRLNQRKGIKINETYVDDIAVDAQKSKAESLLSSLEFLNAYSLGL